MALLCAVTFLSLLSLTVAIPSGCEDIFTPFTMSENSQIFGKWFLHAISSNNQDFKSFAGGLRSFWMELSPIPENNTVLLKTVMGANASCHVSSTSIKNNTLFGFEIGPNMQLQHTCPTCLQLLNTQSANGNLVVLLYLFERNRSLSHSHMEIFRRHSRCRGLEFSLYLEPEKDICLDEEKMSTSARSCEDLLSPVDLGDPSQIMGKWFLIGTARNFTSIQHVANNDSTWMELSSESTSNTALLTYMARTHEVCQMFSSKTTLGQGTIIFDIGLNRNMVELLSCPDCLLMKASHGQEGRKWVFLELWGRTRTLPDSAMDTFKRQVDCLDLGAPQYMNPTAGLCPEHESSKEDDINQHASTD